MKAYIIENPQQISDDELEAMINRLPHWRKTKALSLKNRTDSVNCAVTYLLLCKLLKENYAISSPPEFSFGAHGKPYLKNHRSVFFSISHCKNAVACVIANEQIGVDILDSRSISEGISKKICTQAELLELEKTPDRQKYLRKLWCIKESYSKMTGKGYSDGFTLIEHSELGKKSAFIDCESYCVSVCSEAELDGFSLEKISTDEI